MSGGPVPYGREYSSEEINEALSADNGAAVVPHQDKDGHGTHVAGIAAGNGTASSGSYTGIAPEADLLIVAYRSEGVTLGRSVRALAAFDYMVRKARELGRPVVINHSQGMNSGGHSGETVLEAGLDNLLRQPDVVIVKSAGNEQEWRIHAGGQIEEGQSVSLDLIVSTNDRETDILELWYDGIDRISVALEPPGGPSLPVVTPTSDDPETLETPAGNSVTVDYDFNQSDTGDTRVFIMLSRGHAGFIQPGTWKLRLRGERVAVGRYDVWIERAYRGSGGAEQTRFAEASADDTRTISIPGTARRVITVGSYVTRPAVGFSSGLGQISSFSSRGPTRYGLQKPELAAPGEWIISARSSHGTDPADPDDHHTTMPGTSMAAPHVTGAAALILNVRPNLTCEQVKQILMRAARRSGFAVSAPDNTWGNGKLDVQAAVETARAVQFPVIRDVEIGETDVSWQTDVPTTGAVRFHTHQRQLLLGKNRGSRADLTLQTEHVVSLADLPPDTYWFEVMAFSQDNWWSVDDNAASFYRVEIPPPPTPPGGGG
jgi:subtilisin family serine protease